MSFELHALVKGEVQGVGFRATAHSYARQLKLSGSVRNLDDGQVEIFARGTQPNLEQLLSMLQKSFNINAINSNYTPCESCEGEFKIL